MTHSSCSLRCLCVTFGLIFFTASLYTQAQQSPSVNSGNFSPELIRQLESIKTAALSDDYAYQRLSHLTENIGPRSSGSPAAKAAVEYVAAQLRDLGLDVQLERVTVPHWVRGLESAELVDGPGFSEGTQHKIILTALSGSTSTGPDGINAELVVVDNFDQLNALGRDRVAGKIVLFNAKFDDQAAEAGMGFNAYREVVSYRESGPTQAAQEPWIMRPRMLRPSSMSR